MKTAAITLPGVHVCAPMAAHNAPTVAQQFQNPTKNYRPMVRWWWPSGNVTDAELRREVALMDQAQFGGPEMQISAFVSETISRTTWIAVPMQRTT